MHVTITRRYRPWNRLGWEVSATGPRQWVERMMKKWLKRLEAP